MKNIHIHISVAIVSLMMMVASAFLQTAADAPIRDASGYVTLAFGVITVWATAKALLAERDSELHRKPSHSHA